MTRITAYVFFVFILSYSSLCLAQREQRDASGGSTGLFGGAGSGVGSLGGHAAGLAGEEGVMGTGGSISYTPMVPEDSPGSPSMRDPSAAMIGSDQLMRPADLNESNAATSSSGDNGTIRSGGGEHAGVQSVHVDINPLEKGFKKSPEGSTIDQQSATQFDGSALNREILKDPQLAGSEGSQLKMMDFPRSRQPIPGASDAINRSLIFARQVNLSPINVPAFYQDALDETAKEFSRDKDETQYRTTRRAILTRAEHDVVPSVKRLVKEMFQSESLGSDAAAKNLVEQSIHALWRWDRRVLGSNENPFFANREEDVKSILEQAKENPNFSPDSVNVKLIPADRSGRGPFTIHVDTERQPVTEASPLPTDTVAPLADSKEGELQIYSESDAGALGEQDLRNAPKRVDLRPAFRAALARGHWIITSSLIAVRSWTVYKARNFLNWLIGLFRGAPAASIEGTKVLPNSELADLVEQEAKRQDAQGTAYRVAATPAPEKSGAAGQKPEKEDTAVANMVVGIEREGKLIKIPVLNNSKNEWRSSAGSIGLGLQALLHTFRSADNVPPGSWILEDQSRLTGVIHLGKSRAMVSGKFVPADQDGKVRIEYEGNGTDEIGEAKLYFLQRVLTGLGFSVGMDHGALTASIDKNRAVQSPERMIDSFATATEALREIESLDYLFADALRGWTSVEDNARRLDDLVKIFLAEGRFPFFSETKPEGIPQKYHEYLSEEGSRERAMIENNERLVAIGLPTIPADVFEGRRTRERYYTESLDAAIARGELKQIIEGGRLRVARMRGFSPVARIIESLPPAAELKRYDVRRLSDMRAVQMAAVDDALASKMLLDFETTGRVGNLLGRRAQTRLDGSEILTEYDLFDPETGHPAFARVDLWNNRGDDIGFARNSVGVEDLNAELERLGFSPVSPRTIPADQLLSAKNAVLANDGAEKDLDGIIWTRMVGGSGRDLITTRATYSDLNAEGKIWHTPFFADQFDKKAAFTARHIFIHNGTEFSDTAKEVIDRGVSVSILPSKRWTPRGPELPEISFVKHETFERGYSVRRATVRRIVIPEGASEQINPVNGALKYAGAPN